MPARPPHLDPAVRAERARPRIGLARSEVDRERLDRGWPNLVILDPAPARGAAGAAKKLLRAIEPTLGPVWPREVAIRWANAFLAGVEPFGSDAATLEAGVARTEAPEPSLVKRYFARGLSSIRPPAFKHTDAIFVAEAVLGADEIVRTYADVIAHAPADAWCYPNVVFPNPNVVAVNQAPAIGWVLLRASDSAATEALGVIREARARVDADRRVGPLARAIDFLLGDAVPDIADGWESRQGIAHLDEGLAKARARSAGCLWHSGPQDAWITGVTPPVPMVGRLAIEPRWLGIHLLRQWEVLDHPFVDALRTAVEERPKRLKKKELDLEVEALFGRLVGELLSVRGTPENEAAVVARAATDLVSLRARSGHPMPEEHIGHILAVDGWDKKTKAPLAAIEDATEDERERWFSAMASALE